MKHDRTKQRRDRQYMFERCLETWLSDSPETALRMIAAHIGGLRHDVDELRREIRRLGRDTADTPAKRRQRAARRRAEAYESYRTNTLDRGSYRYQYVDSDGKPVEPTPTTPGRGKRWRTGSNFCA